MLSKIIVFFLLMNLAASNIDDILYNGFLRSNVSLDGAAQINTEGLLMLTNTTKRVTGHAFYSIPLPFKNSSTGNALSFSTTFVVAIVPPSDLRGHGLAFVISASKDLTAALPNHYIGIFNRTTHENPSAHIVAIELDIVQNVEFNDIDNNHVGIDVNSLISVKSTPAAYFSKENGGFQNFTLASGEPIQVWVDYNGVEKLLNVTLSPTNTSKPNVPLISLPIDLSPNISDSMYVGFSSATGSVVASHYVLGWSFKMNGQARKLDLSRLPKYPRDVQPKKKSKVLTIGVPIIAVISMFAIISTIVFIVRRKIKYAEVLEDWEREYGPHRFSYKDLFEATKGFRDSELLGTGGFGMVYKGVLPSSKIQVAVKRVSHKSRQGMKEFIAEIVSLGRLRHRNLVQLLGYCRRKGELLLVYDFMPNGSLDKFLFDQPTETLNWNQRFQIIKGVASGLLYLHEEWEQIVLHRDIKASNVLIDNELNGRLGDFGLARLYDHGTNPQTTHVVGTMGYIAPELIRTGKATKSTDVFAFGAFMLEVACAKRPIGLSGSPEELILVDWVCQCWSSGAILEARDLKLGSEYVEGEMELVLKLGLLCSHPIAEARPSMRQVMQFLDGDCPLPQLSSQGWSATIESLGFSDIDSYPSTMEKSLVRSSSSFVESLLSGGR